MEGWVISASYVASYIKYKKIEQYINTTIAT